LPVSVIYLVYLIYVIASKSGPIPILALCMLAGIYGLQAILFILKRQWQHIGWMIFYILAIPVFSFFLPIYSFWHFDDFSWGNTRVVVGDKKQKKIIVADDEKFDEKMIPLKKWSVYEQELWELGSTGSKETGVTGNTYKSYHTHGSKGNQSAMYDSRTQYGGSQAGGEYDYYRDTNVSGFEKRGGARSQSPMGFNGSVIGGSEYGGAATQDFMMTPPIPRGSQAMSVHSFGPDYATSGHITPMMGGNGSIMMGQQDRGSMMYDRSSGGGIMGGSMLGGPTMMGGQSEYEMPMRPMSQFSIPLSQAGMQTPQGFPTDEEILSEIRNILQTANLMSITKKQGKKN
jgi:chitin synthase